MVLGTPTFFISNDLLFNYFIRIFVFELNGVLTIYYLKFIGFFL